MSTSQMQKSNSVVNSFQNRIQTKDETSPDPRPSRPFGVTAIVGLQIMAAVLILVVIYLGDDALVGGDSIRAIVARFPHTSDLPLIINYAATLCGFVVAPGLWRLRRWAWVLTMFQLGIGLGTSLVNYWVGDPQYLQMLLNVITVFYLNQRDVQQAFLHYQQHPSLQVSDIDS